MASGTSIKDRCRLCYTRLKDTSSSHHKLWCSQHNHRVYNIYKRRPYRYRDLIVRYLSIRLPENENITNENNANDHYSHLVCGACAASLNKLDTAFRTFQQTQKSLRLKFRKTSQIVHYQLDKQAQKSTKEEEQQQKLIETKEKAEEEKSTIPKRQSKRKGAPKHIDQTNKNHLNMKKPSGGVQLIVKIPSPTHNNHEEDDDNDDEDEDTHHNDRTQDPKTSSILPTKRTSPRRKPYHPNESDKTNPKKKLKSLTNTLDASTNDSFKSINLLKSKILSDIPFNDKASTPLHLTTLTGSTSSNSRPINSVKGNHIERIAVSLLSGTDAVTDVGNNGLNHSNGTNDYNSNHISKKTLAGRHTKPSTLEVTTTNNILSSTIPSPSMDDDDASSDDASNDSSNTNTTSSNLNKPSSSVLASPTAEGLTITAINPTGQKQIFMAKQLGNLKKYQCSLCEKIVTNIQIHVRRHTNDKPYPCTYCDKRFTNSGDLQIHVRIHTGEKPYACPLCLKSYRTIGNFNSHVKTHDSGIRPHRCELCSQTFTIPKDWYSHLRSSHRSRTANTNSVASSPSTLSATNTTTTVTKPLFSNCLTSQQQHSEIFIPNKVKLEPINRSQLIIKSTNDKNSSNDDDSEPVNMSKKEDLNDVDDDEDDERDDDDDDDETEENHHQSTRNLLTHVSSPVHA